MRGKLQVGRTSAITFARAAAKSEEVGTIKHQPCGVFKIFAAGVEPGRECD